MFYKEEIIDGILYFKTTPNGEWQKVSEKELLKRITNLKQTVFELNETINDLNRQLESQIQGD